MDPEEVEFVYCIFSETVRRLEKDGLMVVRSCEVCFSKRLRESLNEVLNGSEEDLVDNQLAGVQPGDCLFCVKRNSADVCSVGSPTSGMENRRGSNTSGSPTGSMENGGELIVSGTPNSCMDREELNVSDSPNSGMENRRGSNTSGSPPGSDRELDSHVSPANSGRNREEERISESKSSSLFSSAPGTSINTSPSGSCSDHHFYKDDEVQNSVQKLLNFSSDSDDDLQSRPADGIDTSTDLWSESSQNVVTESGDSGQQRDAATDTDDEDDDQFEAFLLSTRKDIEARSTKRNKTTLSLESFIVSDSDTSIGMIPDNDVPQGGPGVSVVPQGGPGVSDVPQGGPGVSNVPQRGPGVSDVPQGGPVVSDVPQGGPVDSDVPQGGPVDSYVPQGGPVDSDVPQGGPGVSDVPQGNPGVNSVPQGGSDTRRSSLTGIFIDLTSPGDDGREEELEAGMEKLTIVENSPGEDPKARTSSFDTDYHEQYHLFVESVRNDKKTTAPKGKRKSIQAFILSNECGEILEEELDGEGDNEVMIYDERGPEPSRAPVSIRSDLPPSPPSIEGIFATPWTSQRSFRETHHHSSAVTKQQRERVAKEAFVEFNSHVFDNKLPSDTAITWNNRMTKTAGICKYQSSNTVSIDLSTKVCDSVDRIRATLLHEMCHAAVWLVDRKRDGHGPYWRAWANKAHTVYPNIEVSRCHAFDIKAKFLYKCTKCDYGTQRHSKSVNVTKSVCPHCFSSLTLHNGDGTPYVPKKPNIFASFVKENYGRLKQELPNTPHSDIMRQLSVNFKRCKE